MKAKWVVAVALLALPAGSARAAPGEWELVGKGAWKEVLAGAVIKGKLYGVESNGGLYVTDPKTGKWEQLGKPEFADSRFLFQAGGDLYVIEKNGTLYSISLDDGSKTRVGAKAEWKDVLAITATEGKMYAVDGDGKLYAADPKTGKWEQLGKADFANTRRVFAADKQLYTVEQDGTLYHVNTTDGSWERIGKPGELKGVLASAVLEGKVYAAEPNGKLYETEPTTGKWKAIGKADFGNTKILFAAGGQLYSIEKDGSLYHIKTK
jgi:outer membrane protein assembly factor BamB